MKSIIVMVMMLFAGFAAASCKTTDATSGLQSHEMKHGALERSYELYIPKSAPEKDRAMVVGLHGGWGTGEIFDGQAKLHQAADAAGFVLLLPDGHKRSWNAGSCCGGAAKSKVDDVGFIQALVKKVANEHCIDSKKVYATGFSNGAMLTHRIRCEAPDLFAAIAPVAGGPMIESCDAKKAIPSLLIQGRDDPRIFWDGGTFDGSYRPSMASVVDRIGLLNGCDKKSRKSADSKAGCSSMSCGKAPLTWCGVPKVGHQWSGGKTYWPKKLGPNRDDVDVTDMVFRFFKERASAQ